MRRLAVAQAVDLLAVATAGAVIASMEWLLFADAVRISGGSALDYTANWIAAHPRPIAHGLTVAVIFGGIYATWFARGQGRTLGRLVTGTVLVRASGRETNWMFAGVRGALSIVSALMFGAGFFWPIIDRRKRTWHDALTGTVVVQRRLPETA